MADINLFEYATRAKIRVDSTRGALTVEQVWDVPLRAKDDFNLNAIAKAASLAWKSASEENFVESTKTTPQLKLEIAFEIVKHIIAVKLNEEETAKKRAANKVEREKLLAILADKQAGTLSALSEAELRKRIEALE